MTKQEKEFIKNKMRNVVKFCSDGGTIYNRDNKLARKVKLEYLDKDTVNVFFEGKKILKNQPAKTLILNTNEVRQTKKWEYFGKIAKELLNIYRRTNQKFRIS